MKKIVVNTSVPPITPRSHYYGQIHRVHCYEKNDDSVSSLSLEYEDGKLIVNGKKAGLFLTENQVQPCGYSFNEKPPEDVCEDVPVGARIIKPTYGRGFDVEEIVRTISDAALPKCLLDHLVDFPDLWPSCWKMELSSPDYLRVYFWGDTFSNGERNLISYGYWDQTKKKVFRGVHHTNDQWRFCWPAASLNTIN